MPEIGSQKLDAVIPLTKVDWDRYTTLLAPSLIENFDALGNCWIICPESDLHTLPKIPDSRFVAISEKDLVPELKEYDWFLRRIGTETGAGPGWFIQQILKIGAAHLVETPFYLTLDSDVICVRRTRYADLIQQGRAGVQITEHDVHAGWYWWVEQALEMRRSGRTHGVTPAVLSKEGVAKMQAHFSMLDHSQSAMTNLIRRLPWTEYALYFTFLEANGLYDYYHYDRSLPLYDNCVWTADQFAHWSPAPLDAPHLFSVIQSNAEIPVSDIMARLGDQSRAWRPSNRS